ncbi:MAG: desulfoferrodoxin family protein [Bacteroidales bacterium]|nr:desulfoferrodoxin family protein [Bacteroidales bacterium]
MDLKFFICKHCGNIITHLFSSGVKVVCCGEPMAELIPNTSDGAGEKHVPVVKVNGQEVTVEVGSVQHPSLPAHYIQWIALQTENGVQFRHLKPGDTPKAVFMLADGEKAIAAYEYCNLHGLWKAEL